MLYVLTSAGTKINRIWPPELIVCLGARTFLVKKVFSVHQINCLGWGRVGDGSGGVSSSCSVADIGIRKFCYIYRGVIISSFLKVICGFTELPMKALHVVVTSHGSCSYNNLSFVYSQVKCIITKRCWEWEPCWNNLKDVQLVVWHDGQDPIHNSSNMVKFALLQKLIWFTKITSVNIKRVCYIEV